MFLSFALAYSLAAEPPQMPGATVTPVQFTEPVTEVATYPPQAVYAPQSALPLEADTQAALDNEFRADASYFGAFAVGKDGSWGWIVGANSRAAAQEIALAECQRYTSGCLIYAEILPEGDTELAPGQASLAAEPAGYFNSPEDRPAYMAFAASEDGAYAMVWGHDSQQAADQAALADCSNYAISDLSGLRPMPCLLLPLSVPETVAAEPTTPPPVAPAPEPPLSDRAFEPPVTEVLTYGSEGVFSTLSTDPLPADTQVALDTEFRNGGPYFGAFAVGDDGSWGWVVGANGRLAAQQIALEECRRHTPVCTLHAEILPEGYRPLDRGQVSMAFEPAGYFTDPGDRAPFRAFAISEDGAYSMVWGYGSQAEAEAAALRDCNGYVVNDLPDLRAMPCQILPFK